MRAAYQARWISKDRLTAMRKAGGMKGAILLDSFNGFMVIEPVGTDYGDGDVLTAEAADYELRPEWCPGAKSKLVEARKLLNLDPSLDPTHAAKPLAQAG